MAWDGMTLGEYIELIIKTKPKEQVVTTLNALAVFYGKERIKSLAKNACAVKEKTNEAERSKD